MNSIFPTPQGVCAKVANVSTSRDPSSQEPRGSLSKLEEKGVFFPLCQSSFGDILLVLLCPSSQKQQRSVLCAKNIALKKSKTKFCIFIKLDKK